MNVNMFLDSLLTLADPFFAGVPDSLLSPFIDAVMERYGVSDKHIVAANEGAAVGLAAGHYLATARPAIVYMQNSGIGNAVNPICSLLHKKVYAIPVVFVIGWRGEPGTKDEPQHVFQGEVTLPLLDCLEIPYVVISNETNDLSSAVETFRAHIEQGQSVAFVIRKDALKNDRKMKYTSEAILSREEALQAVLAANIENAVYVCTTGKLSREMYELRKRQKQGHGQDFLTVGSMGHSLMIAHGISLAKPDIRVFCLDGDGAALMHMGSLAVAGTHAPKNLIHVVINNGAHETVGGLPAVSNRLNLSEVARSLGYKRVSRVTKYEELVSNVKNSGQAEGPVFIEVICNLNVRADLKRPTSSPIQNRNELMEELGCLMYNNKPCG